MPSADSASVGGGQRGEDDWTECSRVKSSQWGINRRRDKLSSAVPVAAQSHQAVNGRIYSRSVPATVCWSGPCADGLTAGRWLTDAVCWWTDRRALTDGRRVLMDWPLGADWRTPCADGLTAGRWLTDAVCWWTDRRALTDGRRVLMDWPLGADWRTPCADGLTAGRWLTDAVLTWRGQATSGRWWCWREARGWWRGTPCVLLMWSVTESGTRVPPRTTDCPRQRLVSAATTPRHRGPLCTQRRPPCCWWRRRPCWPQLRSAVWSRRGTTSRRLAGGRRRRFGPAPRAIRPPATGSTTAPARCRPTRSPLTVRRRSRPASRAPAASATAPRQGVTRAPAGPAPNRRPNTSPQRTVPAPGHLRHFRSTVLGQSRRPVIRQLSAAPGFRRPRTAERLTTVSVQKCHRLLPTAWVPSCHRGTHSPRTARVPDCRPAPDLRVAVSGPNHRRATASPPARRWTMSWCCRRHQRRHQPLGRWCR